MKRQVLFLSNLEEIKQKDQECAEAFPFTSLIPQELLRDLSEKKRMDKLKKNEHKTKITLSGVFPEIVEDFIFVENIKDSVKNS